MNTLNQARSFLFIPANRSDFLAKAHTRQADVIIVDLEDSIPLEQKQSAREVVNLALGTLAGNGQLAAVRVNGDLSNLVKDLETLALTKVAAIVLPKVEHAGLIKALNEFLNVLELQQGLSIGSTPLIGMIESAEGCCSLVEIAQSSPRLVALAMGSEDLSADLGCEPCEDALLGICQSMVIATRKAGISALGFPGSIGEIADLDKLQKQINKANRMGLRGSFCIHPAQVAVINSGFGYSDEQYDWAQRVVAAMETAVRAGQGVCTVDGQMVDAPVLARANGILATRN